MEQVITIFLIALGFYALGFYHGMTSKLERIVYVDTSTLPDNTKFRTCGTCGALLPEEIEDADGED
jgi:hypothetical protein